MIEKEKFISALSTLFWSWGGDTPSEVIWGANELLEWFEKEHNVKLGVEFEEGNEDAFNYNQVIEAIRKS